MSQIYNIFEIYTTKSLENSINMLKSQFSCPIFLTIENRCPCGGFAKAKQTHTKS